ncbi:DUF421 domain-containing protein [Alteribacter natronophilus]|uniref:DUF421 domain-containing protein n=1 Tax=Alteribacter natronophilus TaxID=2583810 RepID=UPI00110DD7CF|nr:DUF421 domain-containing protein [Alteribacter natronophilus]TMW72042.1 DUF421 domain-containing protein [Alteribacter natronophilus]
MEPQFTDMTIKLILGFFMLFLITRMLGKTTINQLTPFDFVSAIVLSELLGNAVFESNVPISFIIYSIVIWGLLLVLMERILLRFKGLRSLFEGKPSIVIRDGQIDKNELKKNRMNLNQLMSLLRQSETFSVREVAYAILESNGGISVLKKASYKEVTRGDIELKDKKIHLPVSLILDGEVLVDNLGETGHDRTWLDEKLQQYEIHDASEIMYADYTEDDGLYIVPYKRRVVHEG